MPNTKDAVENALNHAVCDGQITLRAAQREIAKNLDQRRRLPGHQRSAAGSSPPARRSAWCTATAAYNSQYWDSQYGDWDVYVHSNQPDAAVTASSGSYSHSWHADASGYADVHLRGPSTGQTIKMTVGAASCSTSTAGLQTSRRCWSSGGPCGAAPSTERIARAWPSRMAQSAVTVLWPSMGHSC